MHTPKERLLAIALCVPAVVAMAGCSGPATTGTSSLTVAVDDLVGAQGSQLGAELRKHVNSTQRAPSWNLLTTAVTGSPFSYSDTLSQLPSGEFTLAINAGSDKQGTAAAVKGQGCEMSVTLGSGERVRVAVAGLNEFGDKGYGPCRATVTRQ